MNEDEEELRRAVKHGLQFTPNLKVKMDEDLQKGQAMLRVMEEEFASLPMDVQQSAMVCCPFHCATKRFSLKSSGALTRMLGGHRRSRSRRWI
jgi:hypothetical protein